MKPRLTALATGLALLAGAGAGTAIAAPPPSQTVGQVAGNVQQAAAGSGAAQVDPSNTNVSVRVLSPGDNGSVSQSNTADSSATAVNANRTAQDASQVAANCGCLPDMQATGQPAPAGQQAATPSGASQADPSSEAQAPVTAGPTTQANDASSGATAGNSNATGQTAAQDGAGTQTTGQAAGNEQAAIAGSSATQVAPKNTAVSVRVLSPGNDGSVSQSNTADSSATAANANSTGQSAAQNGSGACCGSGGQAVGQTADNAQLAGAVSNAKQVAPKNTAISVRVLSPGDGGSVSQSNAVSSTAASGNTNSTRQSAGQDGSGGTQAIGQGARNEQAALAGSTATQEGASNVNAPVRVLSPGHDGSVSQSNDVSSSATAANLNGTAQQAGQGGSGGCCGSGSEQVIGQEAANAQAALAGSKAIQVGASNRNDPVRVLSPGGGGSVSQSNDVSSTAAAGSTNGTAQSAWQGSGHECGCDGIGVQAIGQQSMSEQGAAAFSTAAQLPGHERCGCGSSSGNTADPVRVGSPGHDGSVDQQNTVSSDATAANRNGTWQWASQSSAGAGIQALGQQALNRQASGALSGALQLGASNDASPVRVGSPGGGGSVSQGNDVSSSAAAGNANWTGQAGMQGSTGGCGCGIGIQALGQASWSDQIAYALSGAFQVDPSNRASPARIGSPSGRTKGGRRI